MAYERIDDSAQFDGPTRDSHEVRYRIARQFVKDGDVVLDACCGTGYGKKILTQSENKGMIRWIGIDKKPPKYQLGIEHFDFENWDHVYQWEDFDVFVGLECIEHLNDRGVKRFVELAKRAKKYIVISTPIVENSNPFHVQQFTKEDILVGFLDWELYQYFEQNGMYGIFIFSKEPL